MDDLPHPPSPQMVMEIGTGGWEAVEAEGVCGEIIFGRDGVAVAAAGVQLGMRKGRGGPGALLQPRVGGCGGDCFDGPGCSLLLGRFGLSQNLGRKFCGFLVVCNPARGPMLGREKVDDRARDLWRGFGLSWPATCTGKRGRSPLSPLLPPSLGWLRLGSSCPSR